MTEKHIHALSLKEFGEIPLEIERKTIGICNEVYELKYKASSYILRMNRVPDHLYGTYKFLPLYKKLTIKTPDILAEDYSKSEFPFCYQIQNKIPGKDLGLVIEELSPEQLKGIAKEVSSILDKFNNLPDSLDWEGKAEMEKERPENVLEGFERWRRAIGEREEACGHIGSEVIEIYDRLLEQYKDYFLSIESKWYYDDICSKNVMVHQGEFTGLVDLDFLCRGDYLEAIGRMIAVWYGQENGEIYIEEIIRLQKLDAFQRNIIKVYAIFNLTLWLSEAGIKYNENTSAEINWVRVGAGKKKILGIYHTLEV